MSLIAYQQASKRAETPSSTEYRLFAQVTRALMDAQAGSSDSFSEIAEAVDWNRRVWGAMAVDCAQAENGLPESLRAGIISLSMFISRHSTIVVRDIEEMDILIDLNKTIMQGLADQQRMLASRTVAEAKSA
ncbi:MAG: hypothetical protein COA47_06875 [Robiginitomaculum sp.]|nr:MAG: hypothetical protein COA47_06875 [Robiginitomaculum sp.]